MAPRHWIIYVLSTWSGSNCTLGELQFREVAGIGVVPSGGTPIANYNQGSLVVANLFDGSAATGWATGGVTSGAVAGYIFAVGLDAVELAVTSWTGDASHHPKDIIVFSSEDGVNYVEVARGQLPNPGGGGVTQTMSLVAAGSQEEASALVMHTTALPSDEEVGIPAVVMHTLVGAQISEEWVSSIVAHSIRGGREDMGAVDLIVMHTIFGPVPPAPTTIGPEPVVSPPDDCTDVGNQPEGCCVPEVNGLIETRVGPLNSLEDIRKAIWYLQDRQNVLVREWNKLAAVTRTNFPRV